MRARGGLTVSADECAGQLAAWGFSITEICRAQEKAQDSATNFQSDGADRSI
jgi:hypothetical protein